jgi:hypothetical protein
MTSGIAPLLITVLCAASPSAAPSDAEALIARLARPQPASTAYTEVRFVHLLRKPLVLHGQLDYNGPGRLGKLVEAPYREATTIADGAVEVTREGRPPKHFDLERAPELKALLTGFSALLGGDAATLEQFYTMELVENAANWNLTLRPRVPESNSHLRALVVAGAGNEPRCFSLQQADGDSSTMLLGALSAATLPQPLTPATVAALCAQP